MRTPIYRFLVGTHLQATGNYSAGYYDKTTGQIITSGVTDRKYALVNMNLPEGTQFYLAADNTFLKDNSYLTLYNGGLFLGKVQLSSIMGKPYTLPLTVTRVGITLDVTEMETDNPRPVYILHEADAFYSKLAKKIVRENGQMFFRETLDTDLHFVGFEADVIQAYDVEDRFMLICERWGYGSNVWTVYHSDTFGFTDCSFDLAAHTCKPKLTPLDNYNRLLARYSDEYDLIKLKPEICKIRTSLRPIIEIYEKGSGVITRFLGGTYWETEINSPIDDDTVLTNTEHFGRVTLSDNFAHINVVDVYQGYESYLPKQEYMYDSGNNYYSYTDGQNVYTWSFIILHDGLFNRPFLILERNGNRVMYGSRWVVISLPASVQSASDLPLDFGYSQFDVYGYNTSQEIADMPMGKVTINLYDIWARVVGNTDVLFGVASFDLPQDDFAVDSPSYKKCAPINKDQGYFYITADTINEPTEFGLAENEEYYTNENLPIEGGIHGVKAMPVGKYEWGAFSFWFNYPDNYTILELESRHDYDLRDCFTLGATIRALLAKIDPSIVFNDSVDCSQFFYNSYGQGVTMKGGYDWKLAITPKSNVLKGDYDQAAQKAPITFEELMGMLRDLYGLYWYVDDDRYLHIEHLTWFLNGGSYDSYQGSVQLDLTNATVKDAFNKKMTGYWQEAYEFNMSEAARRLELTYAEKGTEFFEGLSVDVLNSYLREAPISSKSISNFTADLDLMRIEPNRYSSEGFALLAYLDIITPQPPYEPTGLRAVPVTGAVVVTEADGWQRHAYINNLFASWLYSQHFYMYNLSGDSMKVNLKMESLPNSNSLDFVHGLARLRKQKVRFPFDNDPDTVDLIKTVLGFGVPESFEIDALSRTVDATLAFPVKEIVI